MKQKKPSKSTLEDCPCCGPEAALFGFGGGFESMPLANPSYCSYCLVCSTIILLNLGVQARSRFQLDRLCYVTKGYIFQINQNSTLH